MKIIKNRKDYNSLIKNVNVADCKVQIKIKGFEILGLNENEDQFMVFNNSGKLFYIVETSLEELKEFIEMFY